MNEEDSGTLRSVAWSEVFPWLILARAFRLAIGFRSLALAAVGSLLMVIGWWVIDSIFHRTPEGLQSPAGVSQLGGFPRQGGCPLHVITSIVPDRPWLLRGSVVADSPAAAQVVSPSAVTPVSPSVPGGVLAASWQILSLPLLRTLQPNVSVSSLAALILQGVWSLAVWAFFGGVITRTNSVQLACDERLTWGSAFRHTTSRWKSYFSAPLLPSIGVVLIALPIAVLGLLAQTGPGTFLLFLLWPLFLIGGLLMVLLLLGLLFGWPLMWATISTEGTDAFDALSRSYAYVFQRPLHYLFYLIVAGVLGWLGWLLVSQFAAGVVWLTYWAAAWGSSASIDQMIPGTTSFGALGKAGVGGIHFWAGCVKWIAVSYVFSYFWTTACAVYLLLRRNVDGEEMDRVALDEDEAGYELPPLKTEGAGAPVVSEPPAGDAKASDEE